jgi:uncharacterized membrane protein YadS
VHYQQENGFNFNCGLYLKYFTLGFFLGKWLKIDSKTSFITCGTAICGGSAIAAITQSFNQMKTDFNFFRRHFILNSIALFVFPAMGIGCI